MTTANGSDLAMIPARFLRPLALSDSCSLVDMVAMYFDGYTTCRPGAGHGPLFLLGCYGECDKGKGFWTFPFFLFFVVRRTQ